MSNIVINKLGREESDTLNAATRINGWSDPHSPSYRQQIWLNTFKKYSDFTPEKPSNKYTYTPTMDDFEPFRQHETTEVIVKDMDTLYAAKELIDEGYKPLVLNMADWFYAGGCVMGGAKTQEEELFRRSNYYKHLLQSEYPLKMFDAIVSYDVEVYREGPDKDYALIENPWKCHMIASPALDSPKMKCVDGEFHLSEKHNKVMYEKIQQLFYYACLESCDSIVLSAWGCGAFHLPAKEIAGLFKKVLEETKGCLKKVVFGVTNHKNNYDIFKSIIVPACT